MADKNAVNETAAKASEQKKDKKAATGKKKSSFMDKVKGFFAGIAKFFKDT